MTIPSGVQKKVIFGKEATWGVAATAGGASQLMRRETMTLDLKKNPFQSAELRSDQQVVDARHGMRRVEGTLNGELSCLSYQMLWAALFRAPWAAGVTTGAQTDISSSANAFARGAGSFVTDGFKVGDLVIVSGFSESTANGQFIVTGVAALTLSVDGPNIGTDAGGEAVTIAVDGRKLAVPSTGHTNDSFTIEELYEMGATDVSELSVGCRLSSFSIDIKPDAHVKVSFGILGKDKSSDNVLHFTNASAETTTPIMSSSSGVIYKGGVAIAVVTGMTINGNMGAEVGPVIASNVSPDVFMGRFKVSGELMFYFLDNTTWAAFSDETELTLVYRMTAGVDQSFIVNLPRIKLHSADKDDKEVGGLIETTTFEALKYVGSGNYDGTTMVVQDTEVTSA